MADNKSDLERAELLAQIEKLKAELGDAHARRTAAEEMSHSLAASNFVGSMAQEYPTGKTIKINVCVNPWERNEKKQNWKDIEYPTYFYNIQLPPGASGSNGSCLSINGMEYHHGETYEFDTFLLTEMKSRVAMTWFHERSIHGENENAYRKRDPMYNHYAQKRH